MKFKIIISGVCNVGLNGVNSEYYENRLIELSKAGLLDPLKPSKYNYSQSPTLNHIIQDMKIGLEMIIGNNTIDRMRIEKE